MKKYKARNWPWSAKIEEVEVDRETDSSVYIGGRRSAKRSQYENYFDTWEEAHKFLVDLAGSDVDAAQRKLDEAKKDQARINGMSK